MDEKSKDLDKARRYFEQAVHHFDRALEANRKNPYYRQGLSQQYRNLAETLVELKDHAAAVKAAKALAEVFGTRGLDCYYAACFVSRCVPLATEASVRQQYTNQVVALLRSAAARGVEPDKRLKGIEEKYIRPLDHKAIPRLLADLDVRPGSGR
jgi:hypothetical protein